MRWVANWQPGAAPPRVVRFSRTCAVLHALVVDGQRVEIGKAKQDAPVVVQLPGGGSARVRDGIALEFDWTGRKGGKLPTRLEVAYSGEPLRRLTAAQCAREDARCSASRNGKSVPAKSGARADAVSAPTPSVAEQFAEREARLRQAVADGKPLSRERLMLCVFDKLTDPHMQRSQSLLRPGSQAEDGPHHALVERVMRRARHCRCPSVDGVVATKVAALASVVANAFRQAMQQAFGLATFDVANTSQRALFAHAFYRFANGDLGDASGAATEGVPDSGYFFCFAEFAWVVTQLGAEHRFDRADRSFFEACLPIFVRGTRVYFRAFGKPGGMSYASYRHRRFRRDWETVRADLEREFAGAADWDAAQWEAKYVSILQDCCLGNSQGEDTKAGELWRQCGSKAAQGDGGTASVGRASLPPRPGSLDAGGSAEASAAAGGAELPGAPSAKGASRGKKSTKK